MESKTNPNLPTAAEVAQMAVGKPFRVEAELAGAGSSKGMGYWWRLKLAEQEDWQLGMDTIMSDRHPRLLIYAVVLADTDEQQQHDALNRIFLSDLQEQAEMEGHDREVIEQDAAPAPKEKGPYNEFWTYLFKHCQPQNYPAFQALIRREANLPADWPVEKKPKPRDVLHDVFGVDSLSFVSPDTFRHWLHGRGALDSVMFKWAKKAEEETCHTWAHLAGVTEVSGDGEVEQAAAVST